jgi:hypothetical protein
MPNKNPVRRKIIVQAEVNIDAAAWRIFHQFQGSRGKIRDYLSEKLEFNIPQDIYKRHNNTDEDVIFAEPTLLVNFITSLNIMGCAITIL